MQHLTPARGAAHFFLWLLIFGFWFAVARAHHPTLYLCFCATLILVGVSPWRCTSINCDSGPRFCATRRSGVYVAGLLLALVVFDLVAVLSIQALYDHFWYRDPWRRGFWTRPL